MHSSVRPGRRTSIDRGGFGTCLRREYDRMTERERLSNPLSIDALVEMYKYLV